ncbi:MAG: molybdopterin molybdotransferase MoeA [Xanthobacteraceae bacterium]|nr:molybdopterin molybdotransferase MoeA [Xanthobacteraceae bacterium]
MALVPVEEALRLLLDGVDPLGHEKVALDDAVGRVLAADVKALRSQPPFDVSAMDGYAARASDLAANAALKVVGQSAAGHPFGNEITAGEALRIFTGAVVPKGADVVVEQEAAKRDGESVTLPAYPAGKNIRPAGHDFREGAILLEKGHRLNARSLGLAAAADRATIECARRPRIALFSTGDELAMPGEGGAYDRVIVSNPFTVRALAESEGASVIESDVLKDRVEVIVDAIQHARTNGADVVVTMGGASVGDHDLIRPALEKINAEIGFHRIAFRPGKPTLSAKIGKTHVLGLPGNPVSAFVCAFVFLGPLLRKLQGHSEPITKPLPAILGIDLWANDERADYLRATSMWDEQGRRVVTPFLKKEQDSSLTATLAKADCLLLRPANAPAAKKGDVVQVLPLA